MASKFFGTLLPDYEDLDNSSGTKPGYRVYVMENDGGISIQLVHADVDPSTAEGSSVFLNVEEAKEFLKSLQDAVQRAEPKNAKHKRRGVEC